MHPLSGHFFIHGGSMTDIPDEFDDTYDAF
jgi:hypothetical protein